MRISLVTALRYAWGNRAEIASPDALTAYMRRCEARPDAAERLQSNARAGAYPEGPGSGWRYDFARLPVHEQLLAEYHLDEVAGQEDTFTRALQVMDWLTAHTWYNGMEIRACYRFQGKREDALRILRYAYDGGFARAINCRHKALVLADRLMAAGMRAMPLEMTSLPSNHFVVHVWLPEERRWVMLDPSLNAYITDGAGRALNLIDIHERRRRGAALQVAQYSLNGTQDFREEYLAHFVLESLLEIAVVGEECRLLPEDVPPKDGKMRDITVAELLAEPEL